MNNINWEILAAFPDGMTIYKFINNNKEGVFLKGISMGIVMTDQRFIKLIFD